MIRQHWKSWLVVAGLLGVLTVLYDRSRNPDLALRVRLAGTLQDYALVDAQLTRDVLLARAGLLSNYDPLADDRRNLVRAYESLARQAMGGSEDARNLLRAPIDKLSQAQADKLVSVEHFKSKIALFQNSLRYLAFAAPILHIPDDNRAYAAGLGRLSYAVLRFMQTPDAGVAGEIEGVLDDLAAIPGHTGELATLVAHGRLIVTLVPQTNEMLRQIVQAPLAARLADVDDVLLMHTRVIEERAQAYQTALYGVAVLLLAYIVGQFLRLRGEVRQRAIAAAALRVSEARLRAISDSAREAIVSIDTRGCIVAWNAGGAKMFGYSPHEVIGRNLAILWPADFSDAQSAAITEFLTIPHDDPGPAAREFRGVRKDGLALPLEVSLSAWTTQEGRFATAIFRDITQRRQLEERARQQELQLIQANRMAVLGRLISSVTHEISNPNQAILHNARFLSTVCPGILDGCHESTAGSTGSGLGGYSFDELRREIPDKAHEIQESAQRIGRFVEELRHFYLPRASEVDARFDINAAVHRALRLLRPQIGERCRRFSVNLGSGLPPARGDAQRFEQVVINLVANALEALPDPDRTVRVATSVGGISGLVLLVEDQGVGIAAQDLARVREPFFTTRQASGGSGLGLAITVSLLEEMGGTLDLESDPGKGTRATVRLSASSAQAADSGTGHG
jgi:PAS domain S-box-containing protein